jgi:hypothetical protein
MGTSSLNSVESSSLLPLPIFPSRLVESEMARQLAFGVHLGEETLGLFSTTAIASLPAPKRSGGSLWLATWTSALASFAGSPPWLPFTLFQAATVLRGALCVVVDRRLDVVRRLRCVREPVNGTGSTRTEDCNLVNFAVQSY